MKLNKTILAAAMTIWAGFASASDVNITDTNNHAGATTVVGDATLTFNSHKSSVTPQVRVDAVPEQNLPVVGAAAPGKEGAFHFILPSDQDAAVTFSVTGDGHDSQGIAVHNGSSCAGTLLSNSQPNDIDVHSAGDIATATVCAQPTDTGIAVITAVLKTTHL